MEQDKGLLEDILHNVTRLWVFGYGSILWKTGFHYESKKIGYIKGYARRFWQGSTSHRGTPENPGRVATLVPSEDPEMRVWGAAYELVGQEMITEALDHLGVRECLLGGYITVMTPFQDRSPDSQPFEVLMFTATEENSLFLGPASLDALAEQIISCRGPCGHNIQYVTRLADYMSQHIPEETDEHLYGLMHHIEQICELRGLSMEALVNDAKTHELPKNTVCVKCNELCSEYAFCSKCRSDTIKAALTCSSSNNSLTSLTRHSDVQVPSAGEVPADSAEVERPLKKVKMMDDSARTEVLLRKDSNALVTTAAEN